MAEKVRKFLCLCWKYQRANVIIGCMLLALAGMMAVFFLTNEEEPQLVSAPVTVINEGCEEMETNPLVKNSAEEIDNAVVKYYERLAENQNYVEAYEELDVYTKEGRIENTYVVFARYEMKIKGIYTAVPGLGTFYVEKTDSDKIKVNSKVDDVDIQQYIIQITEHEDVRELFKDVETDYACAVQSDAMLAEVLADLQGAVQ